MRPIDPGALLFGFGLALASLPAAASQAMPEPNPPSSSAYGCSKLEQDAQSPVLEGRDGVFFRVFADIRMHHPFSDTTVALLARLSQTLAEQGTTLVYLPIPTKSQAMPDLLPETARLHGYKPEVSARVYQDIIDRLRAAGVVSVHGQNAMRAAEPGTLPYFQADFHWSSEGARLAAAEIAREVSALPEYAELDRSDYVTTPTGTETAFSGLRQMIQRNCLEPIPEPVTTTWKTEKVEDGLGGGIDGGLDLFGDAEARPQIAIVGTSFADMGISNFEGWVRQYTGLDVVNYAITGGNQFGAILSYLTSEDFRAARPHFLIWENPIYNNLLQYGDQPLRELIAAAGQGCTRPLEVVRTGPDRLEARLPGGGLGPDDVLLADAGQEGPASAEFSFRFGDGSARIQTLERGKRLRPTGRFYMPVNTYDARRLVSVSVTFDRPVPDDATLILCTDTKEMP